LNGGGGPSTGGPGVLNDIKNPKDIFETIKNLASLSGSSVANMWGKVLASPEISPSTKSLLESIQNDPQYAGMFSTGGGTDAAPPGYDTGGFGGGFDPSKINPLDPGINNVSITNGGTGDTGQYYDPSEIDSNFWAHPDAIDWTRVNFDKLTPQDWNSFAGFFGIDDADE
jgi:hypothetical protein